MTLQSLIGSALIDAEFCERLLDGKRRTLLTKFELTDEEWDLVTSIEAHSIDEFIGRFWGRLKGEETSSVSLLSTTFGSSATVAR